MKIQLAATPKSEIETPLLVLPIFQDEKLDFKDPSVEEFLKDNPKFGKIFESQLFYQKGRKIMLLGAGERGKFNYEKLQNWVGTATKNSLGMFPKIAISLPQVESISGSDALSAAAVGIEIATFNSSTEFKSENEPVKLTEVQIVLDKVLSEHKEGLNTGQKIAQSVNLVRRLGDMPANLMTPTYFLTTAKKIAKDHNLKITVLDEKAAKLKGMGAFVGVAQGSDEPSYMIALEYRGYPRSKDKWALVGKGITFDSGGISIKPSSSMHEMKYDMLGAATVLSAVALAAQMRLNVNVVAVMAVTENLPGGRAQRPGDIVKSYNGKTAEILNTDAEGRLVLSDALTYAQRDFKANKLIDLATLTGAIIVALGDFITGVFDNNSKFATELIMTGASVGEKFWEMPMDEDYDEMIKSDIADITNTGHGGSLPGAAGAITAAKFLAEFIENDTPWAHLDIAGTGWDMKPKPFRGPGATGVGVKTLIELLRKNQ